MRQLLSVIFAAFVGLVSAQRPFDPILELQITTGMNGVVIATAPDLTVATLSGLYFSGDTLYNTGDPSSTNEIQRLDTFTIVSNVLRASLLNDGVPFSSVNLAPYLDNTDAQTLDTFAIVSNVIRASLSGDNQPFKSVSLAPYLDNTDAQTLSFASPNLSISGGNSVDLSTLLDSKWTDAGTYTYLTATGDNAVVGASTQPSSSYKLQVSGGLFASGNFRFNGAMNINGFEGTNVQFLKGNGAGNPPLWTTPSDITPTTAEISVTNGSQQVVGSSNVTLRLAQQGATSGQVLEWNGTAWAPATDDTGSGGVTAANNGLTLSGSTVQLGGTLIQATTIDQDGFQFVAKDGKKVLSRYNNTPSNNNMTVEIEGLAASPVNTSSPTEDGILLLKAYNNGGGVQYANSLAFGAYTTATDGSWIQSRNQSTPNTYYPLQVNPRGGKFAFSTNNVVPDAAFNIYGRNLGASPSLSAVTLHVASTGESSTYPKISLGTNNTYQGLLWYNGTDQAVRLVGMATGTTVRFGSGPNENDDKVIIMSNSVGRMGVGFSSTTGLHSTLTVNGSFSGAMLETAGAPTFDETKYTVVYTGSTNQTYTLPSASSVTGRVYWINHGGSAGTITLSSSVSSGNGVTFNTLAPGEWCRIQAGVGSWRGKKW